MTQALSSCIHARAAEKGIRSVAQSCPTLCDPMNRSTPGLPVHHKLPEFTETHAAFHPSNLFPHLIHFNQHSVTGTKLGSIINMHVC